MPYSINQCRLQGIVFRTGGYMFDRLRNRFSALIRSFSICSERILTPWCLHAGKASYKDTYLAPFARVAPFMPDAGVPNFAVAPPPGGWVRPSDPSGMSELERMQPQDRESPAHTMSPYYSQL